MISLFKTEDFNKIKRFICIGAHSDDIEMRCGGVFARLVRQGAKGLSVVAVDGPYVRGDKTVSGANMTAAHNIKLREKEAKKGARSLDAAKLIFLHLHPYHFYDEQVNSNDLKVRCPDFSNYEETVEILKKAVFTGNPFVTYAKHNLEFMKSFKSLIKDWQPDAVFTHSLADRHPDHFAVADIVFQAITELKIENDAPVFQWHSGSFGQMQHYQPTHFIELSEHDMSVAANAMKVFSSQFETKILTDYVKKSAQTFGSFAGMKYAQPLIITHFPSFCQIYNSQEYFNEEHRPFLKPTSITLPSP